MDGVPGDPAYGQRIGDLAYDLWQVKSGSLEDPR
jgi:hypothetical protein